MLIANALNGKVAIITGGGTGMGRAMAKKFAELGASVVVASRNLEKLEKVVNEIKEQGGKALAIQCDVRHHDQVEQVVERTIAYFGKIDILVNNAAGKFYCPTEKLTINGWNAVVRIVLDGTFFFSQAVGKHWIEQGREGNILNMITTSAWAGCPTAVHSASAKAGVMNMTRSLAAEWGKYGIRINGISPGPIAETGGIERLFGTEERLKEVIDDVPLGRLGSNEEIADLASYIVSPYAGYLTGEVITLDGGHCLRKK